MNTTTVKQKRQFRIVVGLITQSGGYVKVEERLSFFGIPFWYSSQFGLFDTQKAQLAAWQPLLREEVFESTLAVLAALNAPAADETRAHQVPLGGFLAQVIYAYPRHAAIADAAIADAALMGEDTFALINPRP